MSTLIVTVAQYLIWVLVAVFAVVWLLEDRAGKVSLAAQAVVGLALVGAGIWLLGKLHTDPRPFVTDGTKALFAHARDNGFPSDHAAAGGLMAALVFAHRRWIGPLVAVGAVLVCWARVAAHVHHLQDVAAGLALGLVAGAIAVWLVDRAVAGITAHRSRAVTTADRKGPPGDGAVGGSAAA